jgi:hypothetical protein
VCMLILIVVCGCWCWLQQRSNVDPGAQWRQLGLITMRLCRVEVN